MDKIFDAIKDKIVALIKSESLKNYLSGAPKVPPHTHNKIDNLPINATNIVGLPTAPVTKIIAGTNVTLSPATGLGEVTVSASGGGGGSPGGNDKDVQFNDSSSFGGKDTFQFDKSTNTITLDDGGAGSGDVITGGNNNLNIQTAAKSADSSIVGTIYVQGGDNSGNSYAQAGGIYILGGMGTGSSGSDGSYGGFVIIAAGSGTVNDSSVQILGNRQNVGSYSVLPGSVFLKAEYDTTNSGGVAGGTIHLEGSSDNGRTATIDMNPGENTTPQYGDIIISTGAHAGFGAARGNVQVPLGNIVVGSSTTPVSTNVKQSIILFNTSAPSGSTSGAGILYVNSGALYFRGSSGTVTLVAPA